MSESVPLLRSSSVTSRRRKCYPSSYRFQFIHSKGALLVLFWDVMISIAQNLIVDIFGYSFILNNFYFFVALGVSLVCIISGYVGDFLVSRYRLILVGSYITFILLIPVIIISKCLPSYTYIQYLLLPFHTITLITLTVARVNLLPFNIDQLIGSSSGELTAIIHWHNMGPAISSLIADRTNLFYITQTNVIAIIFMLTAVCIICVGAVLVIHSLFNHYLDTTPVNTVNPVKLIVRVLCYARKHKYPENRSALTYWEEEAPSRLDLGKDKYGGPFTEEEVEDVKTVLRLIPLVIVCTVVSGLYYEYTLGLKLEVYGCTSPDKIALFLFVPYILIIFLHQFLIYPCFHKYIPSMLKRIGMGLVLIVLLNILYTGLSVIGNYHFGQMFNCLTYFDESSYSIYPHQWMLFSNIIISVIWYIVYIVLVEFILAQCPKSMRGTIIGLWFCIWNLRAFIEYPLFLPFLHYVSPEVPLGRGFYYLLTKTIFTSICLIIFLFLAKRYKLRVREVEINIHHIAENHTINNIEQEEHHRRNYAIESSSESTDAIIIDY
uniref:Major facilitator superfamily associated domain-containing protein n=1 Tax=Amphimedon queenslandica TaxID=400682 RepID=A0A1X7V621_AMPQE